VLRLSLDLSIFAILVTGPNHDVMAPLRSLADFEVQTASTANNYGAVAPAVTIFVQYIDLTHTYRIGPKKYV
jgi:hypothetical protein